MGMDLIRGIFGKWLGLAGYMDGHWIGQLQSWVMICKTMRLMSIVPKDGYAIYTYQRSFSYMPCDGLVYSSSDHYIYL